MGKKRTWTLDDLKNAVYSSTSVRQVIVKLGLIPAGGNYEHVQRYITKHKLSTKHFKGQGWLKGIKRPYDTAQPLKEILVKDSTYQTYKLKIRLFKEGLKEKRCEECGWAKYSIDGRLPLELDHINGDKHDNRLSNLRVLCPNCHSLKTTHRGKNIKKMLG